MKPLGAYLDRSSATLLGESLYRIGIEDTVELTFDLSF
jgi:hypothetical protein